MKWTARLHDKNFIDMPSQQVSKVPKPPLGTLDTLQRGANKKNFFITRADIERQYPETLTLANGQRVRLADVLNQALTAEDDPLGLGGDWPDLLHESCLLAFADSLLQTDVIQPVTDSPAQPAQQLQPRYAATCNTCQHFQRFDYHPRLGRCGAGQLEAAAGLWDSDLRRCERHERAPQ